MSSENKTMGEWIDEMPIEDIIRRDDFVRLEVFKRFDKMTGIKITDHDYWEISFESSQRDDNGLFIFHQSKSPQNIFKVFKLKK